MPSFSILVWNVEKFGANFGGHADPVALELLRGELLSVLAPHLAADIEVIVIQELRNGGVGFLETLGAALNEQVVPQGQWSGDWIAGAIVDQATGRTGFTQTAHSEGYGILWKGNRLVPHLAPTPSAVGHLDLVTTGKPLQYDVASDRFEIQAAGAVGPLAFIRPATAQANIKWTTRSGTRNTTDRIHVQEGVRRPCWALVDIPEVGAVVPLVVYHAPVAAIASCYGTETGFASAPLFDAPGGGIYAGDFNVVDAEEQAWMLQKALHTLGYASSTYDAGQAVPSMVHARDFQGRFRTGAGVLTSPRDYAFVKPTPGAAIEVSVGQDILNGLDPAAQNLIVLKDAILAQLQTFDPGGAAVVDNYLNGHPLPAGTDEMTAKALIYETFLSDHLPVVIRYTYP